MKLKRIQCIIMTTALLSVPVVCVSAAEANNETKVNSKTDFTTENVRCLAPEDAVASLGLENPCRVNKDGNIVLKDDDLIDLILPNVLNGQELTSISPKSFAGCPYIRSVVIPESILEIGEEAFADCKYLETIYVFGHSEDDLSLGTNWNGGAEVVYVVDENNKENTTAQDDAEATDKQAQEDADEAPSNKQPSGTEDAGSADKTGPANESTGTEKKAPAAESGSGAEKETVPAQQDGDKDASAPSNDAGETADQGDEGISAENNGAYAPAETSEAAGA